MLNFLLLCEEHKRIIWNLSSDPRTTSRTSRQVSESIIRVGCMCVLSCKAHPDFIENPRCCANSWPGNPATHWRVSWFSGPTFSCLNRWKTNLPLVLPHWFIYRPAYLQLSLGGLVSELKALLVEDIFRHVGRIHCPVLAEAPAKNGIQLFSLLCCVKLRVLEAIKTLCVIDK